ncbi:MAG: hypothetical protein IJX99_04465 [Clostridia bacterium]|nr:hypothetical protein [Clostridia bacterium]
MRIYNIKIRNILLGILILFFLIAICTFLFSPSETIIMTSENYTQILKEIHDNPYDYENKKIEMIGYVFRSADFNENQFVIARDMLISESESRIVGFLCEYEKAKEIENNEWIKGEGKIQIGDYHGAMPIVQIKNVAKSEVPNQIWVYPPNTK